MQILLGHDDADAFLFHGEDGVDHLLDEPSEGLSPKIVEQMVEAILAMKREGVSIVVSEQNLHFARLISDRAYIIERGKICFGGTMAELDARPDIRDAHLSL